MNTNGHESPMNDLLPFDLPVPRLPVLAAPNLRGHLGMVSVAQSIRRLLRTAIAHNKLFRAWDGYSPGSPQQICVEQCRFAGAEVRNELSVGLYDQG